MKIFWDSEFTGLHQNTTLISIGLIADNNRVFYAEFTDYDKTQIDDWLRDNVLINLAEDQEEIEDEDIIIGPREYIKSRLLGWFSWFDKIELWGDCLSYDWVLLSELIADRSDGYPKFPENFIYHSPYDILTLIKLKGFGHDMTREELAGLNIEGRKHNALWDAMIIKACYKKLMALP